MESSIVTFATGSEPVPGDLIPLKEVTEILPSPRAGKKLALSTLYRWVETGRLRTWRMGRWLYVSKAKVLELMKPTSTAPAKPSPSLGLDWANAVLDAAGV